jgi:hypothetical protein
MEDATLLNYHNKRAAQFRTSFEDIDMARKAVRAWGLHEKENLTVMEAYSGPLLNPTFWSRLELYGWLTKKTHLFCRRNPTGNGCLTDAILELPNLTQLIVSDHGDRNKKKLAKVRLFTPIAGQGGHDS